MLVGEIERKEVAVREEEGCFAHRVADVAVVIERGARGFRHHPLDAACGLIRADRPTLGPSRLGRGAEPPEPGVVIGHGPPLEAQRVEGAPDFRRVIARHRLDERLREQLVGALVELGHRVHGFERLLVGALEAVQSLDDLFEPALHELNLVLDLPVGPATIEDLHAIETGGQCFDRLQDRNDLRVLLLRNLAGDEDAEVADVLVQQPHDDLAPCLDLLGRAVDVGKPVERLLRRRDVVAHRREQDDRRLDLTQVERLPVCRVHVPGPELVADEEIAGNPLDLVAVHEVEATPPALELEKAWRLGVHVGEQVVILVPERVRGVQVLEVLHEPGAVEFAVAEVGRQRGEPGAAEQATRIAHRVVALALPPGAAPVGHRSSVEHDRTDVLGIGGREHHRRPTPLAVTDDDRLRALRMERADLAHEYLLGRAHVEHGLTFLGLGKEDHEVHRMPGRERDADLRIVLESPDAGPVPRARVDDDVGTPLLVDADARRRRDAHQRVIDGPRERARVEHRLVREAQDGRQALARVLHEGVAALPERVPEEHRPLRDVHRVPAPADPGIPGRRGLREESRHVLGEGVLHSLGEPLLRELHACEENPRNFDREIVAAAQVCRWTARHDPPRFPLARCSS